MMAGLVDEARRSDLVPFVGAGVPRSLVDSRTGLPAVPSWPEFVERAASRLSGEAQRECESAIAGGDLVGAATIARTGLGTPKWNRLINDSFRISAEFARQPLPLHRAVWRASRGLVITSNYDDSLNWSAPPTRPPRIVGLDIGVDLATLSHYGVDDPILWHLHGSVNNPSGIVMASDGYELVYNPTGSTHSRYKSTAHALSVIAATKSLLFVGFSLRDDAIVRMLQYAHGTYPNNEIVHFVVCVQVEADEIRQRIDFAGLDNIDMLVVEDFGEPMIELIERLESPEWSRGRQRIAREAARRRSHYIRRRCRTVVAGTPHFISSALPMLAEHHPSKAQVLLSSLSRTVGAGYEKSIIDALRAEFQGQFGEMLDISEWQGGTALENANIRLFRGIALDKLSRPREAIEQYDLILDAADPTRAPEDELHLCAEFNRAVCLEKLKDPTVTFEEWIAERDFRFRSGELIWTKAFNMELIRCARLGLPFPHRELLQEAINAEIVDASTGFAKTVTNWCNVSGEPLPAELIDDVEKVARNASISVRIPMLDFLRKDIADPALSNALEDALDFAGTEDMRRLLEADEDAPQGIDTDR